MAEAKVGERNGAWRGDDVGYKAAHSRVRRIRGKASDSLCRCGVAAYEWANLTGNFADVNDYEAMCRRCHRKYDLPGILRSDNSSGATGVSWRVERRKWEVRIQLNGRTRRVGLFTDLATAVEARRRAERERYVDFAPRNTQAG